MIRLLQKAALLLGLLLVNPLPEGWALRETQPAGGDPTLPGNGLWPSPRERGGYRVRISSTGNLLWEVQWESTVVQQPGRTEVKIREHGRGQPLSYKEPVVWEKQMVMEIAPVLQAESVQGSRWTQKGKLLSRIDYRLDAQRGLVSYRDTGAEGGTQKGTFASHPRLIPDELLFHWIRSLSFNQTPAGEFLLVTSPKRRFRMKALVRGTEEVQTPAGKFHCYRVELSPRLGPLEFIPFKGILVPSVTLWCLSRPPHFWVRYEGPVGGPGSPQVVIELTEFKQGAG